MKWPTGFRSGAVACGIRKSGKLDLAALVADAPVKWCGTFTQNAAAAAPVLWSRARLGNNVLGVVVNSGNANACTGPSGQRDVEKVVGEASIAFGCSSDDLLVASTGPIGVSLPVENVTSSLPLVARSLSDAAEGFAEAILTTDTVTKTARASIGPASLVGVAKGSAMLAPNMATMLAFVATDALLPKGAQSLLEHIVDETFNSISVDACESTNDSVFMFSSGIHEVAEQDFERALGSVCRDLAEQMVRDAEGGSKVVRIDVDGAADDQRARDLGRAVAASALWRSAVHGADPNWGRILAAIGSVDRSLDSSTIEVSIGDETVYAGEPVGSIDAANRAMQAAEFTVSCRVGPGSGSARVLSADLSPAYVSMNAGGLT